MPSRHEGQDSQGGHGHGSAQSQRDGRLGEGSRSTHPLAAAPMTSIRFTAAQQLQVALVGRQSSCRIVPARSAVLSRAFLAERVAVGRGRFKQRARRCVYKKRSSGVGATKKTIILGSLFYNGRMFVRARRQAHVTNGSLSGLDVQRQQPRRDSFQKIDRLFCYLPSTYPAVYACLLSVGATVVLASWGKAVGERFLRCERLRRE